MLFSCSNELAYKIDFENTHSEPVEYNFYVRGLKNAARGPHVTSEDLLCGPGIFK